MWMCGFVNVIGKLFCNGLVIVVGVFDQVDFVVEGGVVQVDGMCVGWLFVLCGGLWGECDVLFVCYELCYVLQFVEFNYVVCGDVLVVQELVDVVVVE